MYWGQRAPHTKATREFLESIPGRYSAKTRYCSALYTGASRLHEGVSILGGGAEHPTATHSEDAMATGTDSISPAGLQVCWRGLWLLSK